MQEAAICMRTVKQNCYPDGSRQEAIWGANWNPFTQDIVYESLINIRPRQNRALEILDARIQRTSGSSDSTIAGRVRQTMGDKVVQDRTRLREHSAAELVIMQIQLALRAA